MTFINSTYTFGAVMRNLSSKVGVQAIQDVNKFYEEAVRVLNTLQSNAAVIEKNRQERRERRHLGLLEMKQFSARAGITLDELDKLSTIHVSGTKGKGSTCAFTESLLRCHGYTTGFYSSPHLVEVRERIRINGRPLAKEAFGRYFWDVYHMLDATKAKRVQNIKKADGGMPGYFRFLTILAFHVFLQEKVDVAIIEVGIGGQYDCTNILRSPVVCGVSSLGIDHTSILGKTIEDIAWNKAGIFKSGVPAVTVQQSKGSMPVLMNRARELQAPLHFAPDMACYPWPGLQKRELGIAGYIQNVNASLALQLSYIWLRDHAKTIEERKEENLSKLNDDIELHDCDIFPVSDPMQKGLRDCRWAGRSQILKRPKATYYIDGAHTPLSIETCIEWFSETSAKERAEESIDRGAKVLIFNLSGERKPESLLTPIIAEDFDCAIFVPNIATMSTDSADQSNFTVTVESQLTRCITHKNTWIQLLEKKGREAKEQDYRSESPAKRCCLSPDSEMNHVTKSDDKVDVSSSSNGLQETCPSFTFNCINDALLWLNQGHDTDLSSCSPFPDIALPPGVSSAEHLQILCTGSMHLVGGVLRILDPDMNET